MKATVLILIQSAAEFAVMEIFRITRHPAQLLAQLTEIFGPVGCPRRDGIRAVIDESIERFFAVDASGKAPDRSTGIPGAFQIARSRRK